MGRFLLKPNPREDFYVEYSTVVDAPVRWGSRADFVNLDNASGGAPVYGDELFERADATGSSSLIGLCSHEEDFVMIREGFNPSDLPVPVAYCEIPRGDLRDFLESSSAEAVFNARFPSLRYYAYDDDGPCEVLREDFSEET